MARIVLLEDDAQIRRFVALVLENADVELLECATVAQALAAFAAGPVDLAICDLMLAGESGFELMARIAAEPAWRATRVVAFSAAIDAADRVRLAALGVHRELPKPVGVAELLACVEEALEASGADGPAAVAPEPNPADAEDAAVARFFAGDRGLFVAYRASCLDQFRRDVDEGDGALARADIPALRRLAHSLKTVLATLGERASSERFAALERAAAEGRLAELARLWAHARATLVSAAARKTPR